MVVRSSPAANILDILVLMYKISVKKRKMSRHVDG